MSIRCATIVAVLACLVLAACGGSSSSSSSSAGAGSGGETAAGSGTGASGAATAQAPSEQQSAATGDIPDNQVVLTFRGFGVSLRYPEGWTERRSATKVSFTDKANAVTLRLT